MHLLCYYANLLAWKANGDPRTDDYALKKEKRSIQTSSACDEGCTCADPEIFRQGGGSSPISHHIPQDWSSLRQGGEGHFFENREGSAPPPPPPPPPPPDTRMHLLHLYQDTRILFTNSGPSKGIQMMHMKEEKSKRYM